VLCDTNGGAMPWDVAEIVRGLVDTLPSQVGLHFHDDGGCAVANSLLGIEAGAVHVQGTANGLGERCGNANLFTILADLQLKRGLPLVAPDQLERLTEISHTIAELCNQTTPSIAPYVGHTAFSHKAGLHASALAKAPDMYQHIDPDEVGNRQRLVVSELAGRSNILLKAKELGVEVTDDQARTVLAEVKRRESRGGPTRPPMPRSNCCCAGSPACSTCGRAVPFAALPGQRRRWRRRGDGGRGPGRGDPGRRGGWRTPARGRRGQRPVDALDHAFRNAVNGTWPQLDRIHLSDYKVRILEATAGPTRSPACS
jgi:2-isopropylmalate synthase